MKRIFNIMIITIISMFVFIPNVLADNTYEYTITYDANGGKFEDNKKTNIVSHVVTKYSPRYSHTENIDDTGKVLYSYGTNWTSANIVGTDRGNTKNHQIKIPGVSTLHVEVYYSTEDINDDWACMWTDKRVANYAKNYDCKTAHLSSGYDEKFGGLDIYTVRLNNHILSNMQRIHETYSTDTVTFGFTSNDTQTYGGYGYYAIVTADDTDDVTGEYAVPTNKNSNLIFDGWYYDKECTEDNKVDFNNITSDVTVYAKYRDQSIYSPAFEIVSGDFDTKGSVIRIGTEEFYVLGRIDDNHVKLFAKYNLAVGKGYDSPTYKQDSEATGQQVTNGRYGDNKGGVKFADSYYWWNDSTSRAIGDYEVLSPAGPTDYRVNIYDDNSLIKQHVDKYVEYLNDQCVSVEGRLLTGEELMENNCPFICSDCTQGMYVLACYDGSPEWLSDRSYWISDATVYYRHSSYYGNSYVTSPIVMMNQFGGGASGVVSGLSNNGGVRPVIILDLSKGNTCKKELEPEEEIKEEVKGVEEIKENPKTGVFKNTLSIMVLLVLSLIAYNIVRHIQVFKRY